MKRALVIGVNDYATEPLSGAVRDATEIAAVLETNGDGSPNFAVKLLTSPPGQATRAQIKAAIDVLFKDPSNVALLYFAGHGMLLNTGGYVVTTDAKSYDEGISMDEILTLANASPAKNRVVILDCCHAGAFGTPALNGLNVAQIKEGLTVLTACSKHDAAMETSHSGAFTELLIGALKGGAADVAGRITPGSVYAYVDQALGPWSQRPIFRTNVSEFISLRDVPPRVATSILRKLPQYFPEAQQDYPLDPAHEDTEPHHDPAKVAVFKELQKMVSVGLIAPVGEEHMYYAALHSKSCHLTALGHRYWHLAKEKLI